MRMHAQAGAGMRPMPAAAERAKLATYVALFGKAERAIYICTASGVLPSLAGVSLG